MLVGIENRYGFESDIAAECVDSYCFYRVGQYDRRRADNLVLCIGSARRIGNGFKAEVGNTHNGQIFIRVGDCYGVGHLNALRL